jgi:hypothetical protein
MENEAKNHYKYDRKVDGKKPCKTKFLKRSAPVAKRQIQQPGKKIAALMCQTVSFLAFYANLFKKYFVKIA